MPTPMTRTVALLPSLVLVMWVSASASVISRFSSQRQSVTPCAGLLEGNLELAVSRALGDVTNPDSLSVEFRADFGLQRWPADSVVATSDSVVCEHVDSLIDAWLATPAGAASGVLKNANWGPTAVVRINPRTYYVYPGMREADGWEYNFFVDSVSGAVQFFRGN